MLLANLGLQPAVALTTGRFDPSPGYPKRQNPDLSGEVAVWKVPRIDAAEKQTYTLTLSGRPITKVIVVQGPGPNAGILEGFEGSTVYWSKPGVRMGPPQLVYRDLRLPDKGDQVFVTSPLPH
jgi:hypothetical protein